MGRYRRYLLIIRKPMDSTQWRELLDELKRLIRKRSKQDPEKPHGILDQSRN